MGNFSSYFKTKISKTSFPIIGFEPSKLNRFIFGEHVYLEQFDVLLRPDSIVWDGANKDIELPLMAFDGIEMTTLRQKVRATAAQSCRIVRGFERLVVMAYGKLLISRVGAGRDSSGCVPLRIETGKYMLFWNAKGIFSPDQSESDDEEDYSVSPQASVQRLLREHAEYSHAAGSDTTPQCDFEWWKGV